MASPLLRFHTKLAELRGMKPLTEPPPRYAEWIDFCFGRLQRLGDAADPVVSAAFGGVFQAIRRAPVAKERKVNAIGALKALYDDVLTPRAQPRLGHLGETGHDRLSYICYMLWDVAGLAYWEERDEDDAVPKAVLDVLEHALGSSNDAVVESALHGLGHLASPQRRAEIIGRMLERRPALRPELRKYAEACSLGCIN